MLKSRDRKSLIVLAALTAIAAAGPALAGPPLLCHPFDIGSAKSLPWTDGPSWQGARSDYPIRQLVADTQALLAPATPVVVRMETVRRAAIYAARDPQLAARLFAVLTARTESSAGEGGGRALAYLDAAYYVEAVRQLSQLTTPPFADRGPALRAIVQNSDGYSMATKALALRPGDPAMEFAAALISIDGHRDAYQRHAEKARAGAAQDVLLARNIDHVQ